MLAFAKRLPESWVKDRPARWNRADLGSLQGSTLGVIGLGSIGVEIARRALAFDMPRRRCPPETGAVANARGGGGRRSRSGAGDR